jgi:acetyl-CoA/propionyl-CoA carboxylase, biotin carboxylase, biotin carboxyl carrier protein
VAAAKAVGYRNAGTCEFLLEGTGDDARFYFLEMNTRLQVEHPVTECVVGIDLVHAQLRVASGEPLPFAQHTLTQRGHAIECRVYAEDPANGFIPQAGTILFYDEPQAPGVRVDGWIEQGSVVSVHYDPMLAKLIVWGETRDTARRRAIAALRNYPILGIRTNIPFMLQILEHPDFVRGAIDTGWLDREASTLARGTQSDPPPIALAAIEQHKNSRTQNLTRGTPGTPGTFGTLGQDPFTTVRGFRV